MTHRPNEPHGLDQRLHDLYRLGTGHPKHGAVREQIIVDCVPFVRALAARFNGRGEGADDLFQVGMIGLIKAVDGFDPERGSHFFAYATPTVLGEIKRHFRDRGWAMRPPRLIQQLRADVREARSRLSQQLNRSPTVAELAVDLKASEEHVIEAITAGDQYSNLSLDKRLDHEPDGLTYADILGEEDIELDFVECREAAHPALNTLPEREKRILLLRFYGEKTQREIAAEFGISQMHVSRLITQSLNYLRAQVYA